MGFEFLYTIYTLPNDSNKKQMRSLLTDMVFLSQKKNIRKYDTFGPFVKIS